MGIKEIINENKQTWSSVAGVTPEMLAKLSEHLRSNIFEAKVGEHSKLVFAIYLNRRPGESKRRYHKRWRQKMRQVAREKPIHAFVGVFDVET